MSSLLLTTLDTGNTAWMIMATILVLLMSIPGIALFLWWFGAPEEYPQHPDADGIHRGSNQSDMGSLRIFMGFLYIICRFGQSSGLRHRRFR